MHRAVTAIAYAQPQDWDSSDGGCLRIWLGEMTCRLNARFNPDDSLSLMQCRKHDVDLSPTQRSRPGRSGMDLSYVVTFFETI